MPLLLLLLLLVLLLYLTLRYYWDFQNAVKSLPPGPKAYPFLGNLPILAKGRKEGRTLFELLKQFKREYGSVFTFWLGSVPTVMITDYETAHEACVTHGDPHTGRFQPYLFNSVRKSRGLIMAEGDSWQEHRRFVLQTFKNFGLGRNIMEERIREEIDYFFEDIDSKIATNEDGKLQFDPAKPLAILVGSIINRMILGFRLEEARFEGVTKSIADIVTFVNKNIEKRKADIATKAHHLTGEGDDLIDAYLIEMDKRRDMGNMGTFSQDQLEIAIFDLWMAGMETTITTLLWGLIYLVEKPEEIRKCQQEIDSVVGSQRSIRLSDRPKLPYLSAVIQETQRLASIVTLNVWRKCKQPGAQVGGYTIPEGTILATQISLLLADENVFDNPHEFRPARFIGRKELEARNVPFGVGKRACLGEGLARAELFLIMGSLLQKYDIVMDPNEPPSLEEINPYSSLHRPKPFSVLISKRIYSL